MSKLGVGAYRSGPEVLQAIRQIRARLCLVADTALELAAYIKGERPDVIIIGRVHVDPQPLGESLEQAYVLGYQLARRLPTHLPVDVWTSYCEPITHDAGIWSLERLNRFEVGFTRAMHELGKSSCVLNTGVGIVEPEDFARYFAECLAEADFVGYHAYGDPRHQLMAGPDAIWYALRYRQFVQEMRERGLRCPPFILTESGTYHPWRGVFSEEQIAADYLWLGQEMQKDDYVLGTTAFCLGTPDEKMFGGFDLLGTQVVPAMAEGNRIHSAKPCVDAALRDEEEKVNTTSHFQIGNKWYSSLIGQLPVREGVKPYGRRAFSEIEEITIHHSGSDRFCLDPLSLAEEMVSHQEKHRTKYPEIPYHVVIEKNGCVTVCHPLDALTWHADGGAAKRGVGMNNWRGVGIVLIGDFTHHPPSAAQLKSLREVCAEIDFAMGKRLQRVRHSDVQRTSCPGDTSRGPGNWFEPLFDGGHAQEKDQPPVEDQVEELRNIISFTQKQRKEAEELARRLLITLRGRNL